METKDFHARLYRQLYTIRVFETRCIQLYRTGLIRGYFHPYLGEEAIAVGVCAALRTEDYIVSTHRGHGHCIAKGARLDLMVAELLGKSTGYCRGRGGSMHIADLGVGNLGANGIVGAGIPLGVGAALGSHIRGDDRVTAVFFSDGASNNGVFAESVNLAAIWSLPLILVLENNHYAATQPIEEASRTPDLFPRAQGYGVEASGVDGNDVLAMFERARDAVKLCRNGKGPVLIEAKTYRHMGHHVNDPGEYMPRETLARYKEKDTVTTFRKRLLASMPENEVREIEEAAEKEMEEAIAFAQESPEPDLDEFLKDVEP